MKLSLAIFLCLMILKLSSAHSVTIECDFYTSTNVKYECDVQNVEVFTGDRVSIEETKGRHIEGKTDDDVKRIEIETAQNLKYFPRNLNNVFKNLEEIFIYDSNLTEITRDDLKVFPKLKILNHQSNQIEVIRDGTFDLNQELEEIDLSDNKIRHIDSFAFSKLPKLRKLLLDKNVCNIGSLTHGGEVLEIIKYLEQGVCNVDKEKEDENSSNQNSRNFILFFTISCMILFLNNSILI